MGDKLYKILDPKWEAREIYIDNDYIWSVEEYKAVTPTDVYWLHKNNFGKCFLNKASYGHWKCDSIEHGKEIAKADYLKDIAPYLEEVQS